MERRDVERLLRFLAASFPTMRLTKDVVDAWELAMCTEDAREMQLAAVHLSKTKSENAYMPTVGALMSVAMGLRHEPVASAAECWARGPKAVLRSELERRAWEAWGGYSRWAFLPDPKFCDDTQSAQRIVGFARREFEQLYDSMHEAESAKQERISHTEAVAVLEQLGALGTTKRISG